MTNLFILKHTRHWESDKHKKCYKFKLKSCGYKKLYKLYIDVPSWDESDRSAHQLIRVRSACLTSETANKWSHKKRKPVWEKRKTLGTRYSLRSLESSGNCHTQYRELVSIKMPLSSSSTSSTKSIRRAASELERSDSITVRSIFISKLTTPTFV